MSDDTESPDDAPDAPEPGLNDTQQLAVTPIEDEFPALAWGAVTNVGRVRTENEDDYVADSMVFGVADGMGGHAAGEVASEIAASTLRDRLSGGATHVDVAVAAVVEANAAIFQSAHNNSEQRGMGTTLTALVVLRGDADHPARLALLNVGDSRTYLLRRGEMRRATVDHSYVQELVDTGHITEVEARTHPRRNIVTRALGIEPSVQVDHQVLPMVKGDRFVLCSDGLVDEVPDDEIADIAATVTDPQAAAEQLVALAIAHGGRDNVTVLVVDVLEGIEPPSPGEAVDPEVDWSPDSGHSRLIEADAPHVHEAATPEHGDLVTRLRTRRFTLGTFLFLLAIAVIATVTITLVAVVINNSGDTPPATPTTSTTTSSTSTSTTSTTSTTTTTTTTLAP